MKMIRKILLLGAVVAGLAGCSTVNSLTGQTDDTVLPGQREEAIPGRAAFPDQADPLVKPSAGQAQQTDTVSTSEPVETCQPDDPACQPASGGDGVFSDPQ